MNPVIFASLVILAAVAEAATFRGYLVETAAASQAVNVVSAKSVATVLAATSSAANGMSLYVSATETYALDAASKLKARAYLYSLSSTRTSLKVLVDGTVSAGTLTITSLYFADIGLSADVHTFEGYLSDVLCIDRVIGLDGADMKDSPQNHKAYCLLISQCLASGFAVIGKKLPVANEPVASGFGVVYKFNSGGNTKAEALARTLARTTTDVYLRFDGTIDANGLVTVTSDLATVAAPAARTVQVTPAPPTPTTPQPAGSTPQPAGSTPQPAPGTTPSPVTPAPSTPAPLTPSSDAVRQMTSIAALFVTVLFLVL